MLKGKKPAYILIAVVMGYIPLIVHMHIFSPGLEEFDWFYPGPVREADFFLYYKSLFIVLTAVFMLIFLIITAIKTGSLKMLMRRELVPVCIYAVFVFLSGCLSDNKRHAFLGVCEDFETVLVVLSYTVIFIFSYCFIENEKDFEEVLKYSIPGTAVMHLICLFQAAGIDFLKSRIGKMLILPVKYHAETEKLTFTFGENTIYGTLYNSNYVPQYFCFFFFIFLMMALRSKGSKKALWFCCSGASFICISGSGSKTGIVALATGSLIAAFVYRMSIKKSRGYAVMVLIIPALLAAGVLIYDNSRRSELDRNYSLTDIETNKENIVFHMGEDRLFLKFKMTDEGMNFDLRDEEKREIGNMKSSYRTDVEQGVFAGSVFEYYFDEKNNTDCVLAKVDNVGFVFSNVFPDGYRYQNSVGNYVKMRHIENAGIFRNSFLSGRGNIWNHTIPLIKKTVILGTGAGTFGLVYPQDDYIYKTYNSTQDYFDFHAHSLYLQQILENGFLAAAAFMYTIICCFYLFFRQREKKDVRKNIWLLSALFVYMLLGLTNDSNVCTAPVFWIILAVVYRRYQRDKLLTHTGENI